MPSCLWCGKPLPKRRRKYCSDDHSDLYREKYVEFLWWNNAKAVALVRVEGRCEECRARSIRGLEVHHIVPLEPGEPRYNSPKNQQDNLRVLCRACHEKAHHPVPQPTVQTLPLFEAMGVIHA